jgi:hypothetical protein
MSTVSSLLPVSPALDEIGTLRHLLKAYKSSATGIYCQILFHFPEQLHRPQNMRNLTNVYFGKRTFTYSFPGSAAGAEALKLLLYIIITTSENGDRTPKNVRPQLLFGKNSSFRMSTQISRTLRFSLPLTKRRLEGDATRALKLTEAQEVRLETPPYGP